MGPVVLVGQTEVREHHNGQGGDQKRGFHAIPLSLVAKWQRGGICSYEEIKQHIKTYQNRTGRVPFSI